MTKYKGKKVLDILKPGVLFGDDVNTLYKIAKDNEFAIPAVNVVSSSSINSALQAACEANSPMIIQLSNGGAGFMSNGLNLDGARAKVLGAVSAANHVHLLASEYNIPVILHTDHASKKILPWIDGLLEYSEEYFKLHNRPLFSSHMLDLSEESLEENLNTCQEYFKRMNKIGINIEIELGITGGEEDGVDNTNVDSSLLYTQPEEVYKAYGALSSVSDNFTIAASFGNVHGVYKPGNVQLTPKILDNSQKFIKEQLDLDEDKPVNFVFHGGSGSSANDLREAISYGVIKMNIDTDTQWAYWDGMKSYVNKYNDYLQSQIGNPDGEDAPNKKYYDPRKLVSSAEESMKYRLIQAFRELNCMNKN